MSVQSLALGQLRHETPVSLNANRNTRAALDSEGHPGPGHRGRSSQPNDVGRRRKGRASIWAWMMSITASQYALSDVVGRIGCRVRFSVIPLVGNDT